MASCERCEDYVATYRPAECECLHCEGKWVVTYGNWSRKVLNHDLAEVLAARLNGDGRRPVGRDPLQGLPGGGHHHEPAGDAAGAEVRDPSQEEGEAA